MSVERKGNQGCFESKQSLIVFFISLSHLYNTGEPLVKVS